MSRKNNEQFNTPQIPENGKEFLESLRQKIVDRVKWKLHNTETEFLAEAKNVATQKEQQERSDLSLSIEKGLHNFNRTQFHEPIHDPVLQAQTILNATREGDVSLSQKIQAYEDLANLYGYKNSWANPNSQKKGGSFLV